MITPAYSPTATERVLPRMALDFTTASLDARVTVTRALNTATRTNSSGYVETVNANLPRFDYDAVTLTCKGLLIEETRVNLLTYTEAFNGASWAPTNATVSPDAVASPANMTTADKLIATNIDGIHRVFNTDAGNAVNGTTYTFSVYAKKGEYSFLRLVATLYMTNGPMFDLDTGTISSTGGFGATITPAANGFYRCTATFTATGTNLLVAQILAFPTSSTATYTGDNTSGIYIWGAQFEVGAFATSYIPNLATGTTTRNADVVSMTGTNFSDWYNATEGTFYVQGIPTTTASSGALSIDDGTSNERMQVRALSGGGQAAVIDGGSTQANLATGTWAVNARGQCVFAYKASSFACAAGGAAAATSPTGTVPTVNNLKIGGSAGLNQAYFNGAISKVNYWPQRLTNAEVQAFSKG